MKRIYLYTSLVLLLGLSFDNLKAQGFLRANGQRIVNEKNQNILLRGMGLGGWMLQEGYMLRVPGEGQQHKIRARIDSLIGPRSTQEFYDTWLANYTRKPDIDSMKAWGFNSVRLPMHYNLYTLPVEQEPVAGQNTWLEKGFALTDSLLKWCKANKMYLILDLHAAPGGQGNDLNISDRDSSKPSLWQSAANQQKTVALWRKLAQRYANEPMIAGYDILNEPNWGFEDAADRNGTREKTNAPLRKLLMEITAAIREVDKRHIIIIEGNGWGNNYSGLLPPWDGNMVLSFHKYWNKNDAASISHILKAREQYNVPVWLGETGENSNVWYAEAIRLLEQNNIGWAWWPLKKLGANNPLQIKSNLNYDAVVNYWNGRGRKPNESNAYSGLLELATYTRMETNIVHRDVIDALFRQPFSAATKPYTLNRIKDSSVLQAADYDLGRNGAAYFDTDTADYWVSGQRSIGNKGRLYRNDGVDIRKDSSQYERYYVSDIETGEWLQYTLEVAVKGTYRIMLEVASDTTGGTVSLTVNGKPTGQTLQIPTTGNYKNWQSVSSTIIALNAGKQVIRVYAGTGGWALRTIRFIKEN